MNNKTYHFLKMECYLISEYNDKYLDVENSSLKWGAKIQVTSFHGGPSQKWRIQKNDKTDGYQIFNVNSGHALDIRFGERKGGQIIQWDSNGKSNQIWYFYEDGTIRSRKGYCIKVDDGKNIVSSEYTGYFNQKWKIVQCDSSIQTLNVQLIQIHIQNTNIGPALIYSPE